MSSICVFYHGRYLMKTRTPSRVPPMFASNSAAVFSTTTVPLLLLLLPLLLPLPLLLLPLRPNKQLNAVEVRKYQQTNNKKQKLTKKNFFDELKLLNRKSCNYGHKKS